MTLMVDRLSVAFGDAQLFKGLSFSVDSGDVLSVMGPSGSGKTTLLNVISGSLESSFSVTGQLLLNDHSLIGVAPHKRHIGLQFQDHLLFPHMTVGENLAFGLPRHYRKSTRRERVLKALMDCGLKGYEDYAPKQLSGGQKARVSLMRTLLSEPDLILLDEPFSKLDAELRGHFRKFVFSQIKSRNIPALMVTHDIQDLPVGGAVINLQDWQRF
ncbi:ABC transporter ATP-binding protein [Endozoicomonas sp. (ex Bugula neritina AB1)]|nr:ABC transporter ATP-binding protein [Endozoicomonas sp. (ex Bugula neritina AB1)]